MPPRHLSAHATGHLVRSTPLSPIRSLHRARLAPSRPFLPSPSSPIKQRQRTACTPLSRRAPLRHSGRAGGFHRQACRWVSSSADHVTRCPLSSRVEAPNLLHHSTTGAPTIAIFPVPGQRAPLPMSSFLRQALRRFNTSGAPPRLPCSSPTPNWSSPSPLRRPHGELAVPPPAVRTRIFRLNRVAIIGN